MQSSRVLVSGGPIMENVKTYFSKNSEQMFALTLLLTIVGINYFVPYKLVFLNFYFLVIVLGTYYLETQKAVLGGVLVALLVIIHVYYYPSYFTLSFTDLELWMTVLAWCSFLILTGAVVGRLTSQLKSKVERLEKANLVLQDQLQRAEEWATRLAHTTHDARSSS